MMFSPRHALVLVPVAVFLACSSSSSSDTHPSGDAGSTVKGDGSGAVTSDGASTGDSGIAPPLVLPAPTANITWAKNTTFIDKDQVSDVKSSDATSGVITLD